MITTFYFDEEMFQDETLKDVPMVSDVILEKWSKYGCLAYCEEDHAQIKSAISRVPVKSAQKWIVAFSNYKKTLVKLNPSKMSDLGSYNAADAALTPKGIMTGIVPRLYLELFVKSNNGLVEIIDPSGITESQNFKNSENHSSADIGENDNIDTIWANSFEKLSLHSKKITIIDRYLIENALDDYKKGKKTSIEKFAELLASNKIPYDIEIYSACDIGGTNTSTQEVKHYLNEVLRKKVYVKTSKINFTVALCKNRFFSQKAHDRMFIFDQHAIQTGVGLDIFREQPLTYCQLNIKDIKLTKFSEIHQKLSANRAQGLRSL